VIREHPDELCAIKGITPELRAPFTIHSPPSPQLPILTRGCAISVWAKQMHAVCAKHMAMMRLGIEAGRQVASPRRLNWPASHGRWRGWQL
jgi:hypothetical protein